MKIFLNIFIISIFFAKVTLANYNYTDDKKKQILYFKLDLEDIEKRISANNKLINSNKIELKSYDEEIIKITELLKNIERNQLDSASQDLLNESELIEYGDKLEKLKNSFKQKIIWLYKHGSDYGLQVLFTSNTFNDFYIRYEYLQKITQIRKKDFDRIKYFEYIIEEKKKIYNLTRSERLNYISEKKDDQRTLSEKRMYLEYQIKQLGIENETLSRESSLKMNLIENIEKELTVHKNNLIFNINQKVNYSSDRFSELETKLIYPVNSNYINIDFSKTVNLMTGSITYNNGIDFSISRNSEVKCVADGVVENISFIPSYGNVIIISHTEEYRTVYSIVKDISVKAGQSLNAGDVIAKTSDNFTGQCFHFEIWKNSTSLDPKKWISE